MSLQGLDIKAKYTELTASKIKSQKISDEKSVTDNVLDLSDPTRLGEELNSQDISTVKAVKINDKLVSINPKELKKIVEELKANCLTREGKLNNSFAIDFQNKTGITLYQTDLKVEQIHQLNGGIKSSDAMIGSLNDAFTKKTDLNKLLPEAEAKITELKSSIAEIEKTPDNSVLKKEALIKLKENLNFLEQNLPSYKEVLPKAQEILETSAKVENFLLEKKGSASKTAISMADESDKLQAQVEAFPKAMEKLTPEIKMKAMGTIEKANKTAQHSIDGIKVSQAEDSQRLLRKGTSMYSINTTYHEFQKLVNNGRRKGYPATPEGFVKSAVDDVKSDADLAKKLGAISAKIKGIDFKSLDDAGKARMRAEIGKEAEELFQYQGTNKYFLKESTVAAVKDIYLNQFDLASNGQTINEIEDRQKVLDLAQTALATSLKTFFGMAYGTKDEKTAKDKSLGDLQTADNKNKTDLDGIKNDTQKIKNKVDGVDPNKTNVDNLGFGVKTTGTLKDQQTDNVKTKLDLQKKVIKLEEKNTKLEKDHGTLDKMVKVEVAKDFMGKNLQYGNQLRAIMNKVCDKNGDGKITLGEMRGMDKQKIKDLIEESGCDMGYYGPQIDNLETYVNSLAGQDENMVMIDFSSEHDYQSYWQYHGDSASKEIREMEKNNTPETRDKIQTAILNKSGGNAEIQSLIDNLSKNGQLTAVNLQAISNILDTGNGKRDLAQVSVKLNEFMASDKGRFTHAQKVEIAANILHDLAYPADIDQSNKGTCSAAATQMRIALHDPLKYAEICTTLAQDKDYETTEGDKLHHNDTYLTDTNDSRSLSSKVMQNSFMDFAHGYNQDGAKDDKVTRYYDSRVSIDGAQGKDLTDKMDSIKKNIPYLKDASKEKLEEIGGGLYSNQIDHLEGSIFGNVSDVKEGYFTRYRIHNTKDDMAGDIEKSVKAGVPVTIDFNGHSVIIQSIDNKQNPPKFIIDSWSGQYEMTKEQLEKSMRSARLEDKSLF